MTTLSEVIASAVAASEPYTGCGEANLDDINAFSNEAVRLLSRMGHRPTGEGLSWETDFIYEDGVSVGRLQVFIGRKPKE